MYDMKLLKSSRLSDNNQEGIMTEKNGNDATITSASTLRQPKMAYHRPLLVRYGELASLTQGGITASTSEFFATFYPNSGT